MAQAEGKKINLKFGLSNDKVRAMAGRTLTSGGLPVPVAAIGDPPRRKPGGLSQEFNDAASNDNLPFRRSPPAPSP